MKRRLSTAVFTACIGVCLTTSLNAEEIRVEGPLQAFRGEPELTIQPAFQGGRFPNVVVTMKRTILATWGNGHVRARRSEDGGQTWGDEITIAKSGIHGGGTTFARFNLSWLLEGDKTGDGAIPKELLPGGTQMGIQ